MYGPSPTDHLSAIIVVTTFERYKLYLDTFDRQGLFDINKKYHLWFIGLKL